MLNFIKNIDEDMNNFSGSYLYEKRNKIGDKKYLKWLKKKLAYYDLMLFNCGQRKDSELIKIIEISNLIAKELNTMGSETQFIQRKDFKKIIKQRKDFKKVNRWNTVIALMVIILMALVLSVTKK